jgi:hypothetical protein
MERMGTASLRARVAGGGFVDEVVAAVEGGVATADVESDAQLVILRRSDGHIVEAFHAGGTRIRTNVADDAGSRRGLEGAAAR